MGPGGLPSSRKNRAKRLLPGIFEGLPVAVTVGAAGLVAVGAVGAGTSSDFPFWSDWMASPTMTAPRTSTTAMRPQTSLPEPAGLAGGGV